MSIGVILIGWSRPMNNSKDWEKGIEPEISHVILVTAVIIPNSDLFH